MAAGYWSSRSIRASVSSSARTSGATPPSFAASSAASAPGRRDGRRREECSRPGGERRPPPRNAAWPRRGAPGWRRIPRRRWSVASTTGAVAATGAGSRRRRGRPTEHDRAHRAGDQQHREEDERPANGRKDVQSARHRGSPHGRHAAHIRLPRSGPVYGPMSPDFAAASLTRRIEDAAARERHLPRELPALARAPDLQRQDAQRTASRLLAEVWSESADQQRDGRERRGSGQRAKVHLPSLALHLPPLRGVIDGLGTLIHVALTARGQLH